MRERVTVQQVVAALGDAGGGPVPASRLSVGNASVSAIAEALTRAQGQGLVTRAAGPKGWRRAAFWKLAR